MISTFVSRAAGVVASVFLTGLAFAQADWTQRFPTNVPPKRMYTAMAQFGSGGSVVMFGGLNLGPPGVFSQFNVLDDTWTWNGTNWGQLSPFISPPARYGATMAYDPVSGTAILFGGTSAAGQYLSDMWRFGLRCSGKTQCALVWSQVFPATSPPARAEAAMTFDSRWQRVLLTGGVNGSGRLNDTWIFDADTNSWVNDPPISVNPPIPAFAYTPARSDMAIATCHAGFALEGSLLFGGFSGSLANPLGDTWLHTDTGWSQKSPDVAPAARLGHAMAYYPVSDRAVLYGGQSWSQLTNLPTTPTDTWNGNCNTSVPWTNAAPAHNPGAKAFHAMTTGPSGLTVVLFGGSSLPFPRPINGSFPRGLDLNQTWTWGRQVACVPTDGSELEVGTEVTCLFDPAAGVTFDGWTTEGFGPPQTNNSLVTFHTLGPGEASITAEWTDASGSHSETLDYTIVKRSHP